MAKTALVVDDVAFARKMIVEILISAKYSVLAEASNGAEAIALYKKYKPDFVTMDVVMPKLTGIEATRRILDEDKEAKIIMISALGHEQILMEAVNAGVRDFIIKPFSPEDLIMAVEKALAISEEDSASRHGAAYGNV